MTPLSCTTLKNPPEMFLKLYKGPSVNTSSSFFVVQEKGGEGVEATENGKLVEKPE